MKGSEEIFIDNKSKTGILLLHGFSSTPYEFKELSAYLSDKGFNICAPLIAGHGTCPSDFMKTSDKDWTKSAINAYLKLKKISNKIFIVGDSFGSNLAFWLTKELDNEPEAIVSLGAPIVLRYQPFLIFRLYTYGWLRKYYYKSLRVSRKRKIDSTEDITYSAIPTTALRNFFEFIKKETIPNLNKIKIPVLVAHSDSDPLVHPKSAKYIYENIGSDIKEFYLFQSCCHVMTDDDRRLDLFDKIFDFIKIINKK